jgi:hypothetical protein
VVSAAVMMGYHVTSRATRDTLFLDNFAIAMLPVVGAGTALLSIAAALYAAGVMADAGPRRLVPAAFLVSALLTAFEWILVLQSPRAGALLIFVHTAVLSPLLVSGYWTLLNETLDPWSIRTLIGRITGYATIGVVLGGVLSERVTAALGVAATLPLMVLAHLWCAWSTQRTPPPHDRNPPPPRRPGEATPGGLRLLLDLPHVRNLALIVLGSSISAALLDFAFKATTAGVARNELHFMRVFLGQNVAVAVGTFAIQMSFARLARGPAGPMRAIGVLPATVLLGGTAAFFPSPAAVSVLRGIESILHGSVFRSGYEVLYASLPWGRRRAIRTVIDVGCDRAGDALGAGLNLFVLLFLPFAATPSLLGLGAIVAAGTLIFVARVRHGHLDTLRARVRDPDGTRAALSAIPFALGGNLDPGGEADPDLPEGRQRMIAGAGPRETEARVEAAAPGPREPEEGADPAGGGFPAATDAPLEVLRVLRSGDRDEVERALADASPLDPVVVPAVIRLIAFDGLAPAAARALVPVATRHVGQLVDALLDGETPARAKHRLAELLAGCPSPRAAEGLARGLEDDRFEVRVDCGRALLRLLERDEGLRPERAHLFTCVRRESQFAHHAWQSHRALGPESRVQDFLRTRLDSTYDHLFVLLALSLPGEPLAEALRALRSDAPMSRGAALEYLACVLPVEVRDPLWPLLEVRPPWSRSEAGSN